ncbi:MAG: DUF3619 family protein [Gallionella sp.]|nr:DUF3619 family protein [Gallionella sp.]
MNANSPNQNNNRQRITPETIASLLTRSTQQLDICTVDALHRARNIAMERQSQKKSVFALSTAPVHGARWLIPHSTHQWAAAVILLVTILLGGINYWQHTQEHELSRLDAEILTDDLPLEVFLD